MDKMEEIFENLPDEIHLTLKRRDNNFWVGKYKGLDIINMIKGGYVWLNATRFCEICDVSYEEWFSNSHSAIKTVEQLYSTTILKVDNGDYPGSYIHHNLTWSLYKWV